MKGLRLKRKLRRGVSSVDTAKDVKAANPSTGGFPNIKKPDTTAKDVKRFDAVGASSKNLEGSMGDADAHVREYKRQLKKPKKNSPTERKMKGKTLDYSTQKGYKGRK